ncbi:hypothetical protein Fmac_011624 [Flemingia macrophylla]|uniref:O-methyltransferase C-terminal domain-containing protein n=1 Tax=Flemingia macrophylla TaxID=520843 RepID=A0ABD1MMZ3_9FABA
MFEDVPKGDVILLKAIFHNWSDEKCITILNNCYKALPQNGKKGGKQPPGVPTGSAAGVDAWIAGKRRRNAGGGFAIIA